jgi:putative spermidine/putrescine transport system ATP-binding protein
VRGRRIPAEWYGLTEGQRTARIGRVVSVEYQGTSVHVGFEADGLDATALTAILDDAAYAGRPLALGETVPLGWDAAAAHRLSA